MAPPAPVHTVWTWGWGEFGRLGHGDTISCSTPNPVQLESIVVVACGGHHTVAIASDGDVYAWGWGNEGQLGNGTQNDQLMPALVRGLENHRVCSISCGYYHTAVSTDTGAVLCWGKGSGGQLGLGDNAGSLVPRTVTALLQEKIHQVSCGAAHSLAVSDHGVIFAWGQGGDGQLGLGVQMEDNSDTLVPKQITSLEGIMVAMVACGSRHSMCVSTDGKLFSWGLGDDGRLGHGDPETRHLPTVVMQMEGLRVRSIAGGGHHSALVTDNGHVFTCGRGTYGQLGHGDTQGLATFKQVAALRRVGVVKAACGDTHTLALSSSGEVYAWGAGEDGQLGIAMDGGAAGLSAAGGDCGASVGGACGAPMGSVTAPEKVEGMGAIGDIGCGLVHSVACASHVTGQPSLAKIMCLEEELAAVRQQLHNVEAQV